MTNGEKLEQVFPDGICPFSKSWLDHEYKEPSTKINQDLTKNKSEISTGSTTKNEALVSLGAYKQVAFERDIAVEQLKELGYQLGEKVRKADDCISRKAVITIIQNHWWNCRDIDKLVNELPPVKSIRPKGHWIDVMEGNTLKVECSECKKRQFSKTNFCSSCGSYNREVVEE